MTSELLDRALIEEATKKSGLVWVEGSTGPARALWHVWHEGAACVVGDGPGEQPLPGLADGARAQVTVRSKDKGGRLVSWTATVVERGGRECRVRRLGPTGATAPLPEGSLAAPPRPTPATTRRPAPAGLPRLLARRRRR